MTSPFKRFHRDERAQSLVFSLVSMFALMMFLGLPLNVGWNIHRRIKLQNAADAAAYSAALMEADTLSAVAWINNFEAYLYARLCESVIEFNSYGVYALAVEWGKKNGVDEYPKESIYKEAYDEFKNKILNGRDKYINNRNGGGRTIELWIKNLCRIKVNMLTALPRMMRHEAMRMAHLNRPPAAGDKSHVEMAFFPEDNSGPVALKFIPGKAGSDDKSFVEFAEWEMDSNPFVDRSRQIASKIKLRFPYLDGSGAPQLPPLEGSGAQPTKSGHDAWFDIYTGEPVKGDQDLYVTYSKTVDCWHPDDLADTQPTHFQDTVGHWHVMHTHKHYNCTHIVTKHGHYHVTIGVNHVSGWEDTNRYCFWCNQDTPPRELIISDMNLSAAGKYDIKIAGLHHIMRHCPLCNFDGKGEFPDSKARHGLYYDQSSIYGKQSVFTDHRYGVPTNRQSQVRVFLEDLLTDTYSNWFGFTRADDFHRIRRDTFMPDSGSTPTVWLKEDGEHIFRWGITVALTFPHQAPAFGKTKTYQAQKYMVAMASAKIGVVGGDDNDLPKRVTSGVDESGTYTASSMVDKVLTFKGMDKKMMNLMYTNWGAKLIPVSKSAPTANPVQHIFETKTMYRWEGNDNNDGKCQTSQESLGSKMANSNVNWARLQELIVY